MAPARPAPMTWVGVEAPPDDDEELALVEEAVVATRVVPAAVLVAAAVVVELRNSPVDVRLLPLNPVERGIGVLVMSSPAVSRYVWISGERLENQDGVPVANSEEISEAAAAGLVRASAWIDEGRAE